VRKIIRIDEDKCDGCGACALNCAEGALEIVDGKARVVGEFYCDGLGACIGHCPQGALTIEERACAAYDHAAVERKAGKRMPDPFAAHGAHDAHAASGTTGTGGKPPACGCPGSNVMELRPMAAFGKAATPAGAATASADSALSNWPVQIRLVPPSAPFLEGARLLVASDCSPVATGRFHTEFLPGRVALLGCPKFDPNLDEVREKFVEIFRRNGIRDVRVLEMEVPCCRGITGVVVAARDEAAVDVPVLRTLLARTGETLLEETL
jgi:NAD-dependent dihydropyrimidine dehydrogenase PreA subunit